MDGLRRHQLHGRVVDAGKGRLSPVPAPDYSVMPGLLENILIFHLALEVSTKISLRSHIIKAQSSLPLSTSYTKAQLQMF